LLNEAVKYKNWAIKHERGLGWIYTQPDYDGAPDADCICGITESLREALDTVDEFIELYPDRFK
jgi:hypothetical protein